MNKEAITYSHEQNSLGDQLGSPASVPVSALVDRRWSSSSDDEARALIGLMLAFNNHNWWKYSIGIKKHPVKHIDILNDYQDEIEDSMCRGIAEWDGSTEKVPYTEEEKTERRQLLEEYLSSYNDTLDSNDIKLINDTIVLLDATFDN